MFFVHGLLPERGYQSLYNWKNGNCAVAKFVLLQQGPSVVGTILAAQQIFSYDSIADLRSGGAPSPSVDVVYVAGYNGANTPGGGIFRLDSADQSSADDSGMVIVDATPRHGRWKRDWTGIISASWYGAVADGATDSTAAIQSAIDFVSGAPNEAYPAKTQPGGVELDEGVFLVSRTLVINAMNVTLAGAGMGNDQSSATGIRGSAATALRWAGVAADAAVVQFISGNLQPPPPPPPLGPPLGGGGLRDMQLDGNNAAARCLELRSWRFGSFTNLLAYGATTDNIFLGCTILELKFDPYDASHNRFSSVLSTNRGLDGEATALRLTGHQGNHGQATGNSCLNVFLNCEFQSNAFPSVMLEASDDNFFYGCEGTFEFGSSDQDSSGSGNCARYNQIVSSYCQQIVCDASQTGGTREVAGVVETENGCR